jgi:hypothetical protein
MTPAQIDELSDVDFAAMLDLMRQEAAEIERAQRAAARPRR